MFVISNFLSATAVVLNLVLTIYMWLIIIRALLSWVNPDPYSPIVRFLYAATEPVLARVRIFMAYRLGIRMSGLDISPLVVILVIYFAQRFLVQSLQDLAIRLG